MLVYLVILFWSMFFLSTLFQMAIINKYAKTKQQIADEYGICTKTLNKWLKEENIQISRGLINPKNQAKIYKKFGTPIHS